MSEPIDNCVTYPCFICGQRFPFGPHRYEGKHVRAYRMNVCMPCWSGNWDGWAPHHEAKLLERLSDKGLPIPPRNDEGFLPRDG